MVTESVFIWSNVCFFPWDAFIMILREAREHPFSRCDRIPVLCFPQNSPILTLNHEKSFRQDCDYQMYKLSDAFMRFSSKVLIKCVQKQTLRHQLLN